MDPMGMVLMRKMIPKLCVYQRVIPPSYGFQDLRLCIFFRVFMGMVKMALALVNPVCLIFGYFAGTYD